MSEVLTYLAAFRNGIIVLLACLVVGTGLVQWWAWIFAIGRFGRQSEPPTQQKQALRFIFADITVKIINEFRHLLALIIVVIFMLALGYALTRASTLADLKESLQAVVATLGGLVGSIIGYYFGESSVVRGREVSAGVTPPPPAVQGEVPPIAPAPPPPGVVSTGVTPPAPAVQADAPPIAPTPPSSGVVDTGDSASL